MRRSAFPAWPGTPRPESLWGERAHQWALGAPQGDARADVCVIGAGFTGLWTAFHVKTTRPDLDVMVLDAMQPGYGASGRNGGWCSALMPVPMTVLARETSRAAAIGMQSALIRAVRDIGDTAREHGIDCSWRLGGTLSIATNSAQMRRASGIVQEFREFGFDDADVRLLGLEEARSRIRTKDALGGWFSPHCAAVDPARLVDGLVRVLLGLGVRLHGESLVTRIHPRRLEVATPDGLIRVDARWIVRATEGFTPSLPGAGRSLAPIHSYMVATEPLGAPFWSEVGWDGRETLSDGRHLIIYAQRTEDDRIAFGGRGAPYSFGSRVGPRFDTNRRIHDRIERTLRLMFPSLGGARITHRWGGALGVARDWHPSVLDEGDGLITAGGYAGDGVALSHLAGSAVAGLITGADNPHTRLPLVGHRSPGWEPEPLRWIGINSMLRLGSLVDALEARGSRMASLGESLLDRVLH